MAEEKCSHIWVKKGLWDGKTPDGRPTGGILYICKLCGDRATTEQSALAKGGIIDMASGFIREADRENQF